MKVDTNTQEVRTNSLNLFFFIQFFYSFVQSPADNLPQDNEARQSLPNLQGWGWGGGCKRAI